MNGEAFHGPTVIIRHSIVSGKNFASTCGKMADGWKSVNGFGCVLTKIIGPPPEPLRNQRPPRSM